MNMFWHRISPRNYKSFLARKFLQPDVEETRDMSVEEHSVRLMSMSTSQGVVTDFELLEIAAAAPAYVDPKFDMMSPRSRARTQ